MHSIEFFSQGSFFWEEEEGVGGFWWVLGVFFLRSDTVISQPKPELMNTERLWDHVNGGELDAHEVRKARQLEVDYLNKMRVFERVLFEVAKARMRKEPIKVRWVDTLKGSGIHRSRLVAKEFRRGSKYERFAIFQQRRPHWWRRHREIRSRGSVGESMEPMIKSP